MSACVFLYGTVNFIDVSGDLCRPRHSTLYVYSVFSVPEYSHFYDCTRAFILFLRYQHLSVLNFYFHPFGLRSMQDERVAACFYMLSVPQIKILIYSVFSFHNFFFQYGSEEYPHDSPVGSTRYASPKAGGALYQSEPFFDAPAGNWYTSPSTAYAPPTPSTSYHPIGHSPHLGQPHGHDHYSLSPGVTHDGHLQVSVSIATSLI